MTHEIIQFIGGCLIATAEYVIQGNIQAFIGAKSNPKNWAIFFSWIAIIGLGFAMVF